jgi:hypothetical protein
MLIDFDLAMSLYFFRCSFLSASSSAALVHWMLSVTRTVVTTSARWLSSTIATVAAVSVQTGPLHDHRLPATWGVAGRRCFGLNLSNGQRRSGIVGSLMAILSFVLLLVTLYNSEVNQLKLWEINFNIARSAAIGFVR